MCSDKKRAEGYLRNRSVAVSFLIRISSAEGTLQETPENKTKINKFFFISALADE